MPRIPLQETASYYWTPLCEILDLPQRTLERYQDLFYGRGLKFSSPLWGNTLPRAILFFAAQYPKNTANSAPCWKSHWSVFGHSWPPGNFKCLMRWPQTLYSHSTVDLTKKNRDEFLCPGYCVVSVVTTHSQIQNFSFLLLILNQVESGVAIFSEKIMHHWCLQKLHWTYVILTFHLYNHQP